jgi:hypothetical protein
MRRISRDIDRAFARAATRRRRALAYQIQEANPTLTADMEQFPSEQREALIYLLVQIHSQLRRGAHA